IDKGRLLQAAVVAFAKEVLPDYPQCALRMARFRGITKTEFVDQQQLTGNAFFLLREADVFAGHPEPEFIEQAGEVIVRFIVSGYVPPHRISHDLTERQRRILHALRKGERLRASAIRGLLSPVPSASGLRNELNLLRSFD